MAPKVGKNKDNRKIIESAFKSDIRDLTKWRTDVRNIIRQMLNGIAHNHKNYVNIPFGSDDGERTAENPDNSVQRQIS